MRGPKRVTGALTWGRGRQGGVLSGSFWLPAVKNASTALAAGLSAPVRSRW